MRKQVNLDEAIVKALSKLAVDSPQKNCKNYMEEVLKQHALLAALRDLQNNMMDNNILLTPDKTINPNY